MFSTGSWKQHKFIGNLNSRNAKKRLRNYETSKGQKMANLMRKEVRKHGKAAAPKAKTVRKPRAKKAPVVEAPAAPTGFFARLKRLFGLGK